jgi:hypothetical protein
VSVVCCQVERSLLRADHSSRGFLPSVVRLSAIEEPHRGGLGPLEVVEPLEKNDVGRFIIYLLTRLYTFSSVVSFVDL